MIISKSKLQLFYVKFLDSAFKTIISMLIFNIIYDLSKEHTILLKYTMFNLFKGIKMILQNQRHLKMIPLLETIDHLVIILIVIIIQVVDL